MNETLAAWHKFVETQNPAILDGILSDEVVFHSPVVWKPKYGLPTVVAILTAASQIFSEFKYVREVINGNDAVLEFEARVADLTVRGVDIIKTDEFGKIVDFEVMIRPANGLEAVGKAMMLKLERLPSNPGI